MSKSRSAARQASINSICGILDYLEIHSSHDLRVNFEKIVKKFNRNPNIFRPTDTLLYRAKLFEDAVSAYASVLEYKILVPADINWSLLTKHNSTHKVQGIPDDLLKVTQSYDDLAIASHLNSTTSKAIKKVLDAQDYGVCDTIILGAGDTGTTLWIEKYKAQHGATAKSVAEKKLPDVLMISDGFGGWSQDYTLAQTQSSLERSGADKNPSDFMSTEFYQKNPQANARHVFQANTVCLGKTQAPIFMTNVHKIEKKENHVNWENNAYSYRVIVESPKGMTKAIYTNNVEVCTGLGAANIAFDAKIITPNEVKRLSQFDNSLGFTPVVDGNQFALTDAEVKNSDRTIVIYGGGGTATACYRKSFFGTDVRTYDRPYTADNQKNKVLWVYKDFIGTGKMSANALHAAQQRNEVFEAELVKVVQRSDGKLSLTFKMLNPGNGPATQDIVCDQLVYSIGQNDIRARQVCSEVASDIQVQADKSGMLLYVSTPDQRIRYFGASAVAVSKKEFLDQTMAWLKVQNIGGDVGAGSMPPTRAQIKQHLALLNIKPENINTNMDNSALIKDFLVDAGVKATDADNFIQDVLAARKNDTFGFTHDVLEQLFNKHNLNTVFEIYGHSHMVLKGQNQQVKAPILPMLTVVDRSVKHQPKTSVDDMQLGLKSGYLYSKPPLASVQPASNSASSSSHTKDEVVTRPVLSTAKPSVVGMFGAMRRREESDSFAFISTASNTDTAEEDESAKDKITTTPTIKVSGS
jgi:hypothetical protein